ncbi:MAG TPA: hypothetical protein VFF06_11090 [Polyangia bacterium]|nr:hypothetical protein [Polyangia bacterium]
MARGCALLLLLAAGCNDGGPGIDEGPVPDFGVVLVDLANGCAPQPVPGPPSWTPPPAAHQARCTSDQVDSFASAIAAGDLNALSQLRTQYFDCDQCLEGPIGSTQGAFIHRMQGFVDGNVAGCVALVDGDATDVGCGARVFAQNECVSEACLGCVVKIRADFVDYDLCVMRALTVGPCTPFATSCVADETAAARCEPTAWSSSGDWLRYLGELFCGSAGD